MEKGGGGVKAISRTAFAVNYSAPADLVWHVCKDCGIGIQIPMNLYKSSILRFLALQIEYTKQIFWKQMSELNQQNKSLEHSMTNWIHETNLVWIWTCS